MKRSPLKRTPFKRKSSKSAIPSKVRKQVMERSDGLCERFIYERQKRCDLKASHLHHVLPRGRGGKHYLENLKHLCSSCHRWAHDNPIEAEAQNLMRSWNFRDAKENQRDCENIG